MTPNRFLIFRHPDQPVDQPVFGGDEKFFRDAFIKAANGTARTGEGPWHCGNFICPDYRGEQNALISLGPAEKDAPFSLQCSTRKGGECRIPWQIYFCTQLTLYGQYLLDYARPFPTVMLENFSDVLTLPGGFLSLSDDFRSYWRQLLKEWQNSRKTRKAR